MDFLDEGLGGFTLDPPYRRSPYKFTFTFLSAISARVVRAKPYKELFDVGNGFGGG